MAAARSKVLPICDVLMLCTLVYWLLFCRSTLGAGDNPGQFRNVIKGHKTKFVVINNYKFDHSKTNLRDIPSAAAKNDKDNLGAVLRSLNFHTVWHENKTKAEMVAVLTYG